MTTAMDSLTLRALMAPAGRTNPYDAKAKVLAQVMPTSGLASPLISYAMGNALNNSDEWTTQHEAALEKAQTGMVAQYAEISNKETAAAVLKNVIELSKTDPTAATVMLKNEASVNPLLKSYEGIQFNAKTKDGWATVTGGDGQAFQVYLPNLDKAMKAGTDSDEYKQTVVPIGLSKPEKSTTEKNKTEFGTFWETQSKILQEQNPQQTNETGDAYSNRINGMVQKAWEGHKIKVAQESRPPKDTTGKDQAKPAMLEQVNKLLASKWLPTARVNSGGDNSIYDGVGNVSEAKVRAALTPGQQAQYDRMMIQVQKDVGAGANPAEAIDKALKAIAGGQAAAGQAKESYLKYLNPNTRKALGK